MNTLNHYRTPVAALLLLFSGQAVSASCGEISPRLLELGDQYYELEPIVHTMDGIVPQEATLSALDQVLKDPYRFGTGTRVTCMGSGQREHSVTSHFKLENIKHQALLNGGQLLTALEDVHTTFTETDNRIGSVGKVRNIRLSLPPIEFWRTDATGKSLSSVVANRRLNLLKRSGFHESVWHAMPSTNGVDLEVHYYTNGAYSGSAMWQLKSS